MATWQQAAMAEFITCIETLTTLTTLTTPRKSSDLSTATSCGVLLKFAKTAFREMRSSPRGKHYVRTNGNAEIYLYIPCTSARACVCVCAYVMYMYLSSIP